MISRISLTVLFLLLNLLYSSARAGSDNSWEGVFKKYSDGEIMKFHTDNFSNDDKVQNLDSQCPLVFNDQFTLESITLDDYVLYIEGSYKGLISSLIYSEENRKQRRHDTQRLSFRRSLENMVNVMTSDNEYSDLLLTLISYNLSLGRSVEIVFNESGYVEDEFDSIEAYLLSDGKIENIEPAYVTEIRIVAPKNWDEDKKESEEEQKEIIEEEAVDFLVVSKKPQFPGGDSGLSAWLSRNLCYPEKALMNGLEGRVIVKFIIEKDGSVAEPVIVKGVHIDLDREALRVVSTMPTWMPGENNGKPVRCYYILPITFKNPNLN